MLFTFKFFTGVSKPLWLNNKYSVDRQWCFRLDRFSGERYPGDKHWLNLSYLFDSPHCMCFFGVCFPFVCFHPLRVCQFMNCKFFLLLFMKVWNNSNSISNFHESLQKQHSVRPYLDTYHLNDLNSRNVPEMGCSFIQCNIQGLFPTRSGKKICYKTLYISDLTELQVCNETPTKPNGQLKIDHRVFLRKNLWKPFLEIYF